MRALDTSTGNACACDPIAWLEFTREVLDQITDLDWATNALMAGSTAPEAAQLLRPDRHGANQILAAETTRTRCRPRSGRDLRDQPQPQRLSYGMRAAVHAELGLRFLQVCADRLFAKLQGLGGLSDFVADG